MVSRGHVEPAPLQLAQQIAPGLRALAGGIGKADQFLAAFRRRADQHQEALLFASRRAWRWMPSAQL